MQLVSFFIPIPMAAGVPAISYRPFSWLVEIRFLLNWMWFGSMNFHMVGHGPDMWSKTSWKLHERWREAHQN